MRDHFSRPFRAQSLSQFDPGVARSALTPGYFLSPLRGSLTLDFGPWTLDYSGGVAFGAGCVGLATGVLVAVGAGGGGGSSSTDLLGDGSGAFFRFEFSFVFVFWLSPGVTPPISIGVSPGAGEAVAFGLMFALAGWSIVPPAGMPASDSPVAGFCGSTGELFGSAARVGPGVVELVGCELRVNA